MKEEIDQELDQRLKKGLKILNQLYEEGWRCEYYRDDSSRFENEHYLNCKLCEVPEYKRDRWCRYFRHFLKLCGEL